MRSYAQVMGIPRTEEYIGTGDQAIFNTVAKMKEIINTSARNPYVREWAQKIVAQVDVNDKKNEALAIHRFVRDHVRYTKDPLGFEYLQTPPTILESIRQNMQEKGDRPIGDCVRGDTEVILRNKLTQCYELKNIDELEYTYNQYEALSYDFSKEEWCFKDIIGWADKGIQQTYKVKFYNGTSEYCTLGHKFFNAKVTGGKLRSITEQRLEDIDVNTDSNSVKINYNRVFCAKKIPNLGKRLNKSKEESWMEGLYIAEGYSDGDRISIAQDKIEVVEQMDIAIENMNLAGRWSNRQTHGYFRVATHDSKRFERFGTKSINKVISSEYFSAEEDQIQSLLNGYFDGDGSVNTQGIQFYTTVSKKLSNHLSLLHLILGRPLYRCDYGRPLSKFGNYDVTRLYEFPSDKGYRKEVLKDVALVGPKSVEYIGKHRVYDIEVVDTHNFVSSNGMIVHNCDDMTLLSLSLLKSIGFNVAIKVVSFTESKRFGHVYGLVQIGYDWVPIDCVRPEKHLGWESSGHTRAMETIV